MPTATECEYHSVPHPGDRLWDEISQSDINCHNVTQAGDRMLAKYHSMITVTVTRPSGWTVTVFNTVAVTRDSSA